MRIQGQIKIHGKGFSLIEVLITVTVISIAVFALATAQIRLLKRAENTLTIDRISMEIENMFEYIRSNPIERAQYIATVTSIDTRTSTDNGYGGSVSVQQDTQSWLNNLTNLGATQSRIIETVAGSGIYTIEITYKNNKAFTAEDTKVITNSANINVVRIN